MKDRDRALRAFSEYLDTMANGDVLLITKRLGGKWVINTISGDGYTVSGFGETFEEAWPEEGS